LHVRGNKIPEKLQVEQVSPTNIVDKFHKVIYIFRLLYLRQLMGEYFLVVNLIMSAVIKSGVQKPVKLKKKRARKHVFDFLKSFRNLAVNICLRF
jgi:hypothetical protein